ncbi:MAG TPA: helix-turn-helix domain-containing protein [Nocardioidaceae bacterium]|nr:helix-turn-helix domain-containing protein [Nocardioidaceae bacterium]
MTERPGGLEAWLAGFVADESQPHKIDEWTDRISTPILDESPELVDDLVLARSVQAAVRAHWVSFLANFTQPQHEVHLVQPAVDMARELAQRGLHLTVLFRIYRIAQQATWNYVREVSEKLPEGSAQAEMLVFFWSRASAWIDESIEASVDVYQAERDRIVQGEAAQRLELVRSVIADGMGDSREVSTRLGGYPLSGFNTALILLTEDHDAIANLTAAAQQLARELDVRNPLLVGPGGRELWCWLGTRTSPDLDAVRKHEAWLGEQKVLACVGTPTEGIDGFGLSHREAREAQKVALLSAGDAGLVLFPDIEVLSLLASSPEAAGRFAARTLNDLAEQSESARRLRQTVSALLSAGSVDQAAQVLSVHKNTVRYRVSQAEGLLGYPVNESPARLELALQYFELFLDEDGVRRPRS